MPSQLLTINQIQAFSETFEKPEITACSRNIRNEESEK